MTRRSQQTSRAVKRATRESASELGSSSGSYVPPDRGDCGRTWWHSPIDNAATLRIENQVWRSEGRMVDFVIQVMEVTPGGDLIELFRIDCCGGFCHYHPAGRMRMHEPILRLDVIDDVEKAFQQASPIVDQHARTIRDRRMA